MIKNKIIVTSMSIIHRNLCKKDFAVDKKLQLFSEVFVRQLCNLTKVVQGHHVGGVERHQNRHHVHLHRNYVWALTITQPQVN